MPCPSHSSWLDHLNYIWWETQSLNLLVLQSSPLPYYVVSRRFKSSQHFILESPQPTFLPQCERSNFTTIQNNGQDCSFVYLNFFHCLYCIKGSVRLWGLSVWFVTRLIFHVEELLAPRPASKKLEDNLLSAVRDFLFNTFASTALNSCTLDYTKYLLHRHYTDWSVKSMGKLDTALTEVLNRWES
jgi:hypothetical protein